MKQHITVEQLNELSEKGKKRLKVWWTPRKGDLAFNTAAKKEVCIDALHQIHVESCGKVYGYVFLPLLSIGQMIEYLHEHNALSTVKGYRGNEYGSVIDFNRKDGPCDSLWDPVRDSLNNEANT